ncbi:MAG: MASE1 domain-containing protein [Nostoc sp. ChiSLP02]|nr:MASE1 domain-containing protein [Nostoc sp. DedSLP01]MDZ8185760.1 MASE1 domain-containing protein [Nostoc sp. ChiSLP02]
MKNSRKINPIHQWLMISLLGLLALIAAHGMALIYRIQPQVSLWFPPSGVAIALTFWFGPRGIVLTGLASFLMAPAWGFHGWERLGAFTDTIEPLIAWVLYRRLWRGSRTINTLKDATLFTVAVPIIASASLAIAGNLTFAAMGKIPISSLGNSISHWWLGNAMGIMAIAPTALFVITPYLQSRGWLLNPEPLNSSFVSLNFPLSRRFIVEFSTIILLCVVIATITVAESDRNGFRFQQLSFLSFVPVIWAATRFGVIAGTFVSSFCVLVTLFSYLVAYPNAISLPTFPVEAQVLHVHKLSLLVQCIVSLFVGIAITERSQIQVELAVERVRLGEYQVRAELSEQLIKLNESLAQTNISLEESHREKDELLKREQSLHSRLSNILSSMTDAFIVVNRDWEITYANHQAAKILNSTPADLIGTNYWEQWAGARDSEFEREYERSLLENIPVHFQALYVPWDMWLEIHAYPAEDGLGIFFRDITKRKHVEQEREYLLRREQIARSEAEKANRLKDEFLAILSHELRNPLNPILGWATLLKKDSLEQATKIRGIETIERNAKLQIQLIEDLLDVSRIQRGKITLNIQPVNLANTIEEAKETIGLAIEAKNISLETVLDYDICMVAGDAGRLQQIIWNLLSNAVKFTPAAGKIKIRLQQVNNYAEVQVQDNGKGIIPEFLPFVFDYFRQADATSTREFGGLGLGLAIVKHLTELHGGTVKAESAGEGMGATFTVRLPLMPDPTPIIPKIQPSNNTLSLPGLHILVVDDDADTGEFLTYILAQSGAKVTAVVSAIEALETLAKTKVDLILSDIAMPGIDGYMLMRLIRAMPLEKGGKIPAIALTAYAGEINQKQALAAGFQMYLVKPVETDRLFQTISEVLATPASECSYIYIQN